MASPTTREYLTRDSVPPKKGHFIKKPGAETRLLSSDGRKHPLLSLLVAIPVTVHDERTKTMADPLYGLVLCGEIEGAARAHRHPAHIPALFGSLRHGRPHQVARLKAFDSFGLLGCGAREAVAVHPTHLPRAVPCRPDVQGHHAPHVQVLRRADPHACRIEPMGLGQPPPHAVVLRPPATAAFHWQPEEHEPVVQCPAGGVDRRRIPQRRLDLSQDACQPLRLIGEEVANILVALALVTGRAGRYQITHPVGALLAARMHVIEFQWHLAGVTVGTLVPPLQEDILAHLRAQES